jgi:hypothetical protein
MIQNKRNYTGTEEKFYKEVLTEGLTGCFLDNNKFFFRECWELGYQPKDAIKQYRETNKIYLG